MPIDFNTHKSRMTDIANKTSLKLDDKTSLEELGTFLASKSGTSEILAKADRDGHTILYTRPKGVMNFLRDLRDNFRETTVDNQKVKVYDHKRQFANSEIAKFLQTQGETLGKQVQDFNNQLGRTESFLHENLAEAFNTASTLYSVKSNKYDTARVGQTVKLLANLEMIAGRVTRSLEAHTALQETIPDLPKTRNKALQEIHSFPYVLDGTPVTVDAPNMLIDGKIFLPSEVKGMGGFGALVLYTGPNGEQRAVKLPTSKSFEPEEVKEQTQKAKVELFNSNRMTEGNPHASGFSGHVTLSNGMVALVGEYISKGDLSSLGGKIADISENTPSDVPPNPGKLGEFERYIVGLTLLKDAASGVAAINEKGITHGDVKALNVMLFDDGTAKVIDFGEGIETSRIAPEVHRLAENAAFGAPEYGIMRDNARQSAPEFRALNKQLLETGLSNVVGSLESVLPNFETEDGGNTATDTFLNKIGNIEAGLRSVSPRLNNGNLKVGQSFDTFGLGTLGLELLVGGNILQEKPGNIKDVGYVDGWAKSGNDAIGPGGLRAQGFDYGESNTFLNQMLHSDPEQRLTPSEVRDHPIMGNPAVGSPEARSLILAIQTGDPGQISQAVQTLRDTFSMYL